MKGQILFRFLNRAPVLGLLVVALATLALPARRAVQEPSGAPVRVGLVFDVGGLGDKSFNDAAYLGLVRARDELGAHVEMIEPSGAEDREAALRLFAARGFDLVLGVGFIFSTDMHVVAEAYPMTSFGCIDYAPTPGLALPKNLAGLTFREEEGSFLAGAVAAYVSRSRAVGFVGGMDVPLIRKFAAGYRAGVKHVCSDCRVAEAFAGTTPEAFKDPAKGEALATSQIASGVDVVFHAAGTTGLGVFEAARDMHAWAIGVDSDQHDEMPETVLTSMVKRVDQVVLDAVSARLQGRFVGGVQSLGLKDHALLIVHEGPHGRHLPSEAISLMKDLESKIVAGEILVPNR